MPTPVFLLPAELPLAGPKPTHPSLRVLLPDERRWPALCRSGRRQGALAPPERGEEGAGITWTPACVSEAVGLVLELQHVPWPQHLGIQS